MVELQMFQSKEMIYYTLTALQYLHSLQNVWYGFALFPAKYSLHLDSALYMYVFAGYNVSINSKWLLDKCGAV